MKYIFILGRNPELSIAEIFCFLKKEDYKLVRSENLEKALFVDIDRELEKGTINRLGGSIAIGKVLCKVNVKELGEQQIYDGESNKLIFVLWNFAKNNSYNKASDYLKKRFKEEKLKASEKPLTGTLELQDGKKERISAGLIDREYFVTDDYFGIIHEKTNYKGLEERDMNKPTRREDLAISPRLAKIMINLSLIKKGEILLDPFCGIGVILQEALLQDIKSIGIDKDESAIHGARKNLEWHKFTKDRYQLINNNSKIVQVKAHSIATEPELGEKLKILPTRERTNVIIRNYEKLIFGVFSNFRNRVFGRIVFTSPLIKQHRGPRVGANINSLAKNLRMRVSNRFQEFRENQIVGREIYVLEKIN